MKAGRTGLFFAALSGALALAVLFSLTQGAYPIPLGTQLRILTGRLAPGSPEADIILRLRLPRVLAAVLVGGALSVAGVVFQGLFRNPLAEPYTLGVSGGAAVAVAAALFFLPAAGWSLLPLFGLLGAWLAVFIAYSIARRRKILKVAYLLLVGVMVSFISSSLISLFLAITPLSQFRTVIFWAMGSLEGVGGAMLGVTAVFILPCVLLAWSRAWVLNALVLGEEGAASLGIELEKEKRILFFIGSALAGAAVAAAGIIGFVGLIVPHFLRLGLGRDHRFLVPASFLAGALFLLLCDLGARRLLSPLELPVGVVTGIVGGLGFILLLSRSRKE